MKTIQVAYYREGDQWVAQALNVEVSSFGDSREEAEASIREALELFFEEDPEIPIPAIESVSVGEVNVQVA